MSSRRKLLETRMRKSLRSPYVATLLTLLLLLTGVIGSIFSREIRDTAPLNWLPSTVVTWTPQAFWVMAVLTGLLFFLRQSATDYAREQAQQEVRDEATNLKKTQAALQEQTERLVAHSNTLENLLRTMPPENFLEQFVQLYATADGALEAFKPDTEDREAILRLGILHHLRIIAYLAQKFDGDRTGARYAANIMLFRPAAHLTDEMITDCTPHLKFCDESLDCRKLLGLLDLVPEFSSTSDDSLEPDSSVRRIVLPIPRTHQNQDDKWLVLPGAPIAFITGKASGFADVQGKLRDWLDNDGDFQDTVKAQLAEYFREHQHVRSFVSIPMLPSVRLYTVPDPGEPLPVGVLNIHVDRPGLLRGGDVTDGAVSPIAHFNAIIQPFVLNLVKLLAAQVDTPGEEPKSPKS